MLRLLGGEFGSLGLFEGGTHSGSEKRRYGEFLKNVFIWLSWILVVAHRIFSYGMWDLIP